MVVGSSGKHYTVTLQDEKPTCQCMDFRIRKRQCKHITLVLQSIGAPTASDWAEVCSTKMVQACAQHTMCVHRPCRATWRTSRQTISRCLRSMQPLWAQPAPMWRQPHRSHPWRTNFCDDCTNSGCFVLLSISCCMCRAAAVTGCRCTKFLGKHQDKHYQQARLHKAPLQHPHYCRACMQLRAIRVVGGPRRQVGHVLGPFCHALLHLILQCLLSHDDDDGDNDDAPCAKESAVLAPLRLILYVSLVSRRAIIVTTSTQSIHCVPCRYQCGRRVHAGAV